MNIPKAKITKFKEVLRTLEKKQLLVFLLLITLGALLTLLYQFPKITQLAHKAQGPAVAPQNIKISNIYPRGFTVGWVTAEKTTGALIFGQDREDVEKTETQQPRQTDNRGEEKMLFTHSVTIEGLEPEGKYYFKILSGDRAFYKSLSGEWTKAGIAESVTLAKTVNFISSQPASSENTPGSFSKESEAFALCQQIPNQQYKACFHSNLIYGQVVIENQDFIEEALVFLEIPGKSNLLSTTADPQGKWTIDLANFFQQDLSGPLIYQPTVDLLRISAQRKPNEQAVFYRSIPKVTAPFPFSNNTNPVILTLLTPPEYLPTPTPESPTPTPTAGISPTATPTQLPPPPLVTLNFSVKFQAIDNKGPIKTATVWVYRQKKLFRTQKLKLIPQQNGLYGGEIFLARTGEFEFVLKAEKYLKKNFGTISLDKGKNSQDFSSFSLLAGDLNNDNQINSLDISLFLEQLYHPTTKESSSDFDNDGKVTTNDLGILTGNYYQTGD